MGRDPDGDLRHRHEAEESGTGRALASGWWRLRPPGARAVADARPMWPLHPWTTRSWTDATPGVRTAGARPRAAGGSRGDRRGGPRRGAAVDNPQDRADGPTGAARHAAATSEPGPGSARGAHDGGGRAVRPGTGLSHSTGYAVAGPTGGGRSRMPRPERGRRRRPRVPDHPGG